MRTLVHISDLHFGKEDPDVAEGLVRDIEQVQPDLVVNSGDFTQRARTSQYKAAANYIKRLPQPQLSVPGNHDIPLFDLFRRFISPLKRYKEYITADLFPRYVDDTLTVIGINTARSMTWKSGRISGEQIENMERLLSGVPTSHIKAIVTHHPFIPPPGQEKTGVDLVGRAARALKLFDRFGVDLMLAGHLHHGYTGDIRTYYPSTEHSIVVVQAGTAISNRIRREPNGYNVIRLEQDRIEITVRRWSRSSFIEAGSAAFECKAGRWISVD